MFRLKIKSRIAVAWSQFKWQNKLSVTFVLTTVIPLLLTTAISSYQAENALVHSVFEQNQNLAERTAEGIDRMFQEKIRMLRIIAESPDVTGMEKNELTALLETVAVNDTDFQIVIIADTEGRQLARSDDRPVAAEILYKDRPYFQEVLKTRQTAISEVLVAKSTGRLGIVIAEPIFNEQYQLNGVLIANLELTRVSRQIQQIVLGDKGYIFVVDSNGRIVLHPDQDLVEQAMDFSWLEPVNSAVNGNSGWSEYVQEGQKKLAGYSYIKATGWGLVAQQPMEEALEHVYAVKRTQFVIMGLAAVIAAFVGVSIAGLLTKPLTHMAMLARRLADGQMEASLYVAAKDEVGQLADALNHMMYQLKYREDELRASEEKYRSVVENINVGVYRKTGAGGSSAEYVNPALVKMLGYSSQQELLETPFSEVYYSYGELAALLKELETALSVKNREIVMRKKDGSVIICAVTASVVYDPQKGEYWIDSVVEDITQRKQSEEKLRQTHDELEKKVLERTQELTVLNEKLTALNGELQKASLLDALTGIANRRYLEDCLAKEWQRATRERKPLALIMMDVDYFKAYNDGYGHIAGDECLRKIAAAIKAAGKRPTDLAARYGGEEFALVLPNTDLAGARKVAKNLLEKIRELGIVHEYSAVSQIVTISLGVAVLVPSEKSLPSVLVAVADRALYQAKEAGRNRLQIAGAESEQEQFNML